MNYDIKAIPTAYAGVNFRSRLEARWAAFFDQCGWKWDYEPFDLEGWAPDFKIATNWCPILVEVKPIDLRECYRNYADSPFAKAFQYWEKYQILLLGIEPICDRGLPGIILDPPDGAKHGWLHMLDLLETEGTLALWREAGNIVQWQPDNRNYRRRRAA